MTRGMMKSNAKESLRGNWGIAILALLIGGILEGRRILRLWCR